MTSKNFSQKMNSNIINQDEKILINKLKFEEIFNKIEKNKENINYRQKDIWNFDYENFNLEELNRLQIVHYFK